MTNTIMQPDLVQGINLSPVYVLTLLAGAGSVIAFLYKKLISTKDDVIAAKEREFALLAAQKEKAIADLDSINKSYREIADEAIKSAADMLAHFRKQEGKPPVVPLAAVIPESHSDSTPEQRILADLATMRQRVAQLRLESGQPAKEEPGKAGTAYTDKPAVVPTSVLGIIKNEIAQVPNKTADKVVEKLEEKKI